MRHNQRHTRGRRNNNNSGGHHRRVNPRVHTFDSNGPDVRVRGNAFQITEKYQTLARDAAAAGDRVLAESYYQHAEHYQRLVNESNNNDANNRRDQNGQQQGGHNANGGGNNGRQQQEQQAADGTGEQ
ncbi:MAG: DUF4167 domain-containing protein, partial [Alphaproteobacteria bacterium]|nr:DUF4167 domain-containing protein [Alphaproteobacteria bacterium]